MNCASVELGICRGPGPVPWTSGKVLGNLSWQSGERRECRRRWRWSGAPVLGTGEVGCCYREGHNSFIPTAWLYLEIPILNLLKKLSLSPLVHFPWVFPWKTIAWFMWTESHKNPSSGQAEIIMRPTGIKLSLPSSVILKGDHFSLWLMWNIYITDPQLESSLYVKKY